MKNLLFKSTLHEIKGSFGRWIAILAIVALGVGFFAGLKVCKPAFTETANEYLHQQNFFDYQLISTLGLEDEDVEIIKDVFQVGNAEGSYSADVLVSVKGAENGEIGTKFLTISKEINIPSLVAGRMPTKADQCLVDATFFTEEDIGKTISISKNNTDTTLDMLAYDTYTITGLANTPLYLNYERGSTSIGDGTISAFVLIPKLGFSSDVYTEIYATLAYSPYIFTKEYEQATEDATPALEEAMKVCSDRRYNSIINAAEDELSSAEDEINSKKEDIEAAENEISSSEEYLYKFDDIIGNAVEKYQSSSALIEEQRQQAYKNLDRFYELRLITKEEYEQSKKELDEQYATTQEENKLIEEDLYWASDAIDEGIYQINDAKNQISDGKSQIADAENEISEARKEISKIKYPVNYVLGRETNIGYACFDNDVSIVDGIAKVFPLFFFMVAALVCMTTMSRMIEEQRTQIGILKALGYNRKQILWKYIFYSGSSALVGGIGGFFIGTYLFSWVIWEAYKMMYGFADIIFVVDLPLGFVALLAALLCSVGTTVYSCYGELSQVPAQLIRPKAPAAGKRILLERIPIIWNRIKFLQKVSIRNVFRYKKRFFMMVLGICGCTALLVAAFGVNDSVRNVVSMQYDEISHVDFTVSFNHNLSSKEEKTFLEDTNKYADECLFLYTSSVDARVNDEVKTINLVVKEKADDISPFIDLHLEDKKINYPGKGEGVINDNLANILGLKVGDDLTVYDSDNKAMTIKISGVCENYVFNYLYITDETYIETYEEYGVNSAYIVGASEEQTKLKDHEVAAKLMDATNVASVTSSEEFKSRIENIMKSLDYIIVLIIACAGALAFIVLYNLTNINITERIREIATIKVLGFYPRETSSYVFRENIILTGISAIVGLPLGKLLHSFIMSELQVSLMNFDVHVAPLSYVYALVGTFVFSMIVNLVMKKKLDKISMIESLKSVE
ncbi:MAG: FtsX-like permease family protein [Firmicutes bacterium]|nr:FtsX-like permease family protein [Bacillota bacterium]